MAGRLLGQLLVMGGAVVGRAVVQAYRQAIVNAQRTGAAQEAVNGIRRAANKAVSTRHYFAFGALVSEELSYKLKELPKVRWVLPDSYLNVKDKDYGGEPFINGQAVPYDPKYHEDWVRNRVRANEPRRRNDRPRNFDRPRNSERRRENTEAYQSGPASASYQSPPPPSPGQNQMPPRDAPTMRPAKGPPPSGFQPNYQPHPANPQSGYIPGGVPNYQNAPPPRFEGATAPGYQATEQETRQILGVSDKMSWEEILQQRKCFKNSHPINTDGQR